MTDEYVEGVFKSFAQRNTFSINKNSQISSNNRLALASVCKRPEIRSLLNGVEFELDQKPGCAFIVENERIIRMSPDILKRPVLAAFHLRHALEITIHKRCLIATESDVAVVVSAIAAFHTAAFYLDGMIHHEKEELLANLPAWTVAAVLAILGQEKSHRVQITPGKNEDLERLLSFQGAALSGMSNDIFDKACDILDFILPLSRPTEKILTQGGDTRLEVDEGSGLNQYGCCPRPRPWAITFSSCTASSISDYAYSAAERLRQDLMSDAISGKLVDRCSDELERIRDELIALLTLDRVPGTEVILTPSGTDGELYALYLAMGNSNQGVRNILISSTEIGNGSRHAAGGLHFDTCTPLGEAVKAGDPMGGFASELVEVKCLELRHESGALLTKSELDAAAKELVEEAIEGGRKVVIHLLDCSKTGIGGPSIELVQGLKNKYQSLIEVVVDAAQMRLGRAALLRYVEYGFMVLITGSKFFTGPPFSGALIVPPHIVKIAEALETLPAGMKAYGTRYDLPRKWEALGTELSPFPNLGLLLRWQSAMWEMRAFYGVSALDQFNTINNFGQAVRDMIEESPDLDLVMAPPHDRGHPSLDLSWDQLPSIFTFLVYKMHPDTGVKRPLTYEEARVAYHHINMDIARFLPVPASDRENGLAAKRCHIGQPVRIRMEDGKWIGALRIAAGARLVSGVKYDNALGSSPSERLDTEIRTAGVVLSKLSVIVKYWDDLAQYDLESGANSGSGFYLF